MPKRILDGEALWGSNKLGAVMPLWVRAEYANLLPLALANGVFECDAKRIWAEVFAFNRPDRSPEDVGVMIESLAGAGMLFRWEVEGKTWGFWVGINKQGRLPEPSHRSRFLC